MRKAIPALIAVAVVAGVMLFIIWKPQVGPPPATETPPTEKPEQPTAQPTPTVPPTTPGESTPFPTTTPTRPRPKVYIYDGYTVSIIQNTTRDFKYTVKFYKDNNEIYYMFYMPLGPIIVHITTDHLTAHVTERLEFRKTIYRDGLVCIEGEIWVDGSRSYSYFCVNSTRIDRMPETLEEIMLIWPYLTITAGGIMESPEFLGKVLSLPIEWRLLGEEETPYGRVMVYTANVTLPEPRGIITFHDGGEISLESWKFKNGTTYKIYLKTHNVSITLTLVGTADFGEEPLFLLVSQPVPRPEELKSLQPLPVEPPPSPTTTQVHRYIGASGFRGFPYNIYYYKNGEGIWLAVQVNLPIAEMIRIIRFTDMHVTVYMLYEVRQENTKQRGEFKYTLYSNGTICTVCSDGGCQIIELPMGCRVTNIRFQKPSSFEEILFLSEMIDLYIRTNASIPYEVFWAKIGEKDTKYGKAIVYNITFSARHTIDCARSLRLQDGTVYEMRMFSACPHLSLYMIFVGTVELAEVERLFQNVAYPVPVK